MSVKRPFTREQRTTIIYGMLAFVLVLVILQLWLLTATMNAYLGGDESVIWPAAGASLAFITALGDFVVSIVLYTYSTRPISIEILSSLRLQELGVGAVYGVLLMVAGGAAFLLWGRREAA